MFEGFTQGVPYDRVQYLVSVGAKTLTSLERWLFHVLYIFVPVTIGYVKAGKFSPILRQPVTKRCAGPSTSIRRKSLRTPLLDQQHELPGGPEIVVSVATHQYKSNYTGQVPL